MSDAHTSLLAATDADSPDALIADSGFRVAAVPLSPRSGVQGSGSGQTDQADADP